MRRVAPCRALRGIAGAVLLAAGWLGGPTGGAAQGGAGALAADCRGPGGPSGLLAARCADAALAAHALTGGIGLLAAAGGAVPVSPSTAGRRVEGTPRVVLDLGTSFSSFHFPDLARAGDPAVDRRRTFIAGRASVVAGVFDGFSPAATVGGVGSVDVVGTVRVLRLPSSQGFGGSVAAVGAGVRVGVLRESFSLPGVTLTALHHRVGTVRFGDVDRDGARAVVEPRATSMRLEVGKDLLALGVTGGVAWDRFAARSRISAQTDDDEGVAGPRRLRDDRRYLFAGMNYTWLVTQLAGEIGWAPGGSAPELDGTGPYRAGRGSLLAAITFRVRY